MKPHAITYHDVSRETFPTVDLILEKQRSALSRYLDRLLWWNRRINLVSRDVPRETIWEHIRHSLLLSAFSEFKSARVAVDAGTGGGLPGIPLAITHPQKLFVLNDIVSKKCLAVKQMVKTLGLDNIEISDRSIGKIEQDSPFLLISKHAFKIDRLWNLTAHLPWEKMVFYKGSNFEKELKTIEADLAVSAYDLSAENRNPFYKEKAVVIVERR